MYYLNQQAGKPHLGCRVLTVKPNSAKHFRDVIFPQPWRENCGRCRPRGSAASQLAGGREGGVSSLQILAVECYVELALFREEA